MAAVNDIEKVDEVAELPVESQRTDLEITEAGIAQAGKEMKLLREFISKQLVKNEDYGVIPGVKKPSLWKGGAEKLLAYFGLSALPERTSNCIEDWEKGFFHYEIRCPIVSRKTGKTITVGWGSCNSREEKYQYRWVFPSELPSDVDKDSLVKRTVHTRRGYKTMYRIKNEEPWSLQNTILKMAVKRAVIDGTLRACRASFFFTQDVEDMGPAVVEPEAEEPVTTTTEAVISEPEEKATKSKGEPGPSDPEWEEARQILLGLLCEDCFTNQVAKPIVDYLDSGKASLAWIRSKIKWAQNVIEKKKGGNR